jgi:hypothetical protein
MKLHHAAALALLVWYLMFPPMNSWPGTPWIDRSAPSSKWSKEAAFDSARDCEIAREKQEMDFARAVKSEMAKHHETHPNLSSQIDEGVLCIASDDPRLKRK